MATTFGPISPALTSVSRTFRTGLFRQLPAGSPDTLEFGEWIASGLTPSSISYELGTSAFGTDLGFGTVAQNSSNSHFLFSNRFGYDIYDVTIPVTSAAMTAGNTYWVSLSNATDPGNSGTEAWDVSNGLRGGPATCNFRQRGINFGDCGGGGNPSRSAERFLSPAVSCCSVLASWDSPVYCVASSASDSSASGPEPKRSGLDSN